MAIAVAIADKNLRLIVDSALSNRPRDQRDQVHSVGFSAYIDWLNRALIRCSQRYSRPPAETRIAEVHPGTSTDVPKLYPRP